MPLPASSILATLPRYACWTSELAMAAEMKHSETAFLAPDLPAFGLRWFTPLKEVKLCGHATLASAHRL